MIWLSNRMAAYFVKHGANKEDEEVYAYGMIIILSAVLELLVTYAIALFLGKVWEITFFLIGFIPLRRCAGGYHSKTPEGCLLLTVFSSFAGIYLGGILQQAARWILPAVILSAVVTIFLTAPVVNKNKPLKKEEIPKFRKLARAMSIILLIAFGILWYAFAIPEAIPLGMGMVVTAAALVAGKIERRVENEKVLE